MKFQMKRKITQFCITLLGLLGLSAHAATYYVDPVAGNDDNSGTSRSQPWRSIPGSRTVDDANWLRDNWGAVSLKRKIAAGDNIEIKAGSVISKKYSGRLLIDSQFYDNGTSDERITLRVSSDWGSGAVIFDASGMSVPEYQGGLQINSVNYFSVLGKDSTQRFVITQSPVWGLMSRGTIGEHQRGLRVRFVELAHAHTGGMNVSYSDHWLIDSSVSHDNGDIGFAVGGINDERTIGGEFRYSQAYKNGALGSGGVRHGFGVWAAEELTFQHCVAHNNKRDGFDFGSVTNTNDTSVTVIASFAYENGEDGFAANGGTGSNQVIYRDSLSQRNFQAGWHIYDGVSVTIENSAAVSNGYKRHFGGNFMVYGETNPAQVHISDTVGYQPGRHANIYSFESKGQATVIRSNNNIFVPRNGDSDVFAETPYGRRHSYQMQPDWLSVSDLVGKQYKHHAAAKVLEIQNQVDTKNWP